MITVSLKLLFHKSESVMVDYLAMLVSWNVYTSSVPLA